MAEKNTHSILETIKKKLTKFDQKAEKPNKISDVSDEFEYITPTRKSSPSPYDEEEVVSSAAAPAQEKAEAAATDQLQPAPATPAKNDDLDFGSLNEAPKVEKSEAAQVAPASEAAPSHNLDDLDLDDESSAKKSVAAVPEKTAEVAPSNAEEFSEDDIEDYEDEVDFGEEVQQENSEEEVQEENDEEEVLDIEEQSEVTTEVAEEVVENNELSLDAIEEPKVEETSELEFKEEPQEAFIEQAQSAVQEQAVDVLDLDLEHSKTLDLDTPILDVSVEEVASKPAVQNDDEDLNFDDLEKDDILSAPISPDVSTSVPEKIKEEKPTIDDLDLEALEREVEEHKKKQEEAAAKHTEVVKDEIDLEFEKELMGLDVKPSTPAIPVPSQAAPIVESQPSAAAEIPNDFMQQTPAAPVADFTQQEEVDNILFEEEKPAEPQMQQPQNPLQFMDNSDYARKDETRLVSDSTMMQTTESIKKLIDAKNVVSGISSFSQSPALAELAIQLMEPKLEKWLNDNLPQVVEKIVREEIKKIIPKE